MEISKFTKQEATGLLAHYDRIETSSDNPDIDTERTHLNYSLTPYTSISCEEYQKSRDARRTVFLEEREYYKKRLAEVYCYKRDDVKTLVDCVITSPQEIQGREETERFFAAVFDFLANRYGGVKVDDGRLHPNIISATVHFDESTVGQPHMHFAFIPIVEIDKTRLMEKKNHVKKMEDYDFKVSAKEVCSKKDLATLHQDLQAYLDEKEIEGRVLKKSEGTGRTISVSIETLKEYSQRHGGKRIDTDILHNLTLDRLEELYVKAKEYDRLQEKEVERAGYFKRDNIEKELVF